MLKRNKTRSRQILQKAESYGKMKERFVKGVDFSTLKELKNKYVTDENKYRENDIIYEIKIKNETLYFYILLEFQSTVDKFMPVRMLTYIMLFYQDLIKKSAAKKVKLDKLPAVFPILLYNGEDKWTTPSELKDLIEVRYEALGKYIPNFAYYKIIENEFSQESLKEIDSINAALFGVETTKDPEEISDCVLRLTQVLKREASPELRMDFRPWINQLIRGCGIKPKEVNKIMKELEEGNVTNLESNLKKMKEEAEKKGIEKGSERTRKEERAKAAKERKKIAENLRGLGISEAKIKEAIKKAAKSSE